MTRTVSVGPVVPVHGRNGYFECQFVAVLGDSDGSKVKQVTSSAAAAAAAAAGGDVAGVR